jgi:hypothetical protein
MEIFILLGGVIQLIILIQFFRMGTDISQMNKNFKDFTKYYYELQNYNIAKVKETCGTLVQAIENTVSSVPLMEGPIGEKLTIDDYKIIYQNNIERFTQISNYFYKNDKAFYHQNIDPVYKSRGS